MLIGVLHVHLGLWCWAIAVMVDIEWTNNKVIDNDSGSTRWINERDRHYIPCIDKQATTISGEWQDFVLLSDVLHNLCICVSIVRSAAFEIVPVAA